MFPSLQTRQARFASPANILGGLELKAGMQVADFGCGAGEWVLHVSRMVGPDGRVFAIDIRDEALSSVRSRARMEGALNIELVRANLEVPRASGLPNASQDIVLLTNILFQSSKKEQIAAEAARVLKSGGSLVFVDWRDDSPLGPNKELRTTKKGVVELMVKAGFGDEREAEAGAYHFGMVFHKR